MITTERKYGAGAGLNGGLDDEECCEADKSLDGMNLIIFIHNSIMIRVCLTQRIKAPALPMRKYMICE